MDTRKSGLWILVCVLMLANGSLLQAEEENEEMEGKNTRIYTVFSSSGLMPECRIYPIYHPDERIIPNEEILSELKKRCKGVEFVTPDNITAHYNQWVRSGGEFATEVAADIRKQQKDKGVDGILFFGNPSDKIVSMRLPVVAVYPLWGQWMFPFNAYKGKKVLTSCLPVIYDRDRSIYSSRLDDIAEKIRMIQAISKMKGRRMLLITDNPVLGAYEPELYQTGPDRKKYERVYLDNLEKTFGSELVTMPQDELIKEINKIKEKEAKKVAGKWIREAEGIRGTNEVEIVKSAKVYLAMKELKEKYNAQAISAEGYCHFAAAGIPSLGLASTQFFTDGIIATSETLVDSMITQHLGLYITGRMSFQGDYLIDSLTGIVIIGHCEGPLNPYGDDRKVPYVIRNLPLHEENKGGACVQINYPVGETVTLAKISMHGGKIAVFTGKTVSGEDLFKGWDDLLCRTKLAIKTNAKALLEDFDPQKFGNHRVVFFGDHRQKFKDLATLIGFEVVEEDK